MARGDAGRSTCRRSPSSTARASSPSRCSRSARRAAFSQLFLAPVAVARRQADRVHLAGQLPARRGLPRPLARRRRDRASASSGWCRRPRRRTSRSCACSIRRARSRRTGSCSRSRRSAKGATCCTSWTSRSAQTIKRFDVGLEWVTSPSWTPDGKQIVFSGTSSGITDLYVIDYDDVGAPAPDERPERRPAAAVVARRQADRVRDRPRRDDRSRHAAPRTVAASPSTTSGRGSIEVLPGQGGHNLNPQWAPDGKSIAYVSDRTGIANIFLVRPRDQASTTSSRTSSVRSAAITEYSPAITWARQADKLAFTYFEDGDYTVWMIDEPAPAQGRAVPRQADGRRHGGVPVTGADVAQTADAIRAAEAAAARTTCARPSTQSKAVRHAAATTIGARRRCIAPSTASAPSADVPGMNERSGSEPGQRRAIARQREPRAARHDDVPRIRLQGRLPSRVDLSSQHRLRAGQLRQRRLRRRRRRARRPAWQQPAGRWPAR